MANSINWFELPATNFSRACKFYSDILDGPVQVVELENDVKMGMLPNFSEGGVGGHIGFNTGNQPSATGSLVYLNGGEDLSQILDRVEAAGGTVVQPKSTSPGGFMGLFMDSEGNRVALHSQN